MRDDTSNVTPPTLDVSPSIQGTIYIMKITLVIALKINMVITHFS